jgi:predicted transcriptional regulator
MAKRGKLEIMQDILYVIQQNHSPMKITPLIRRSNISSARFKEYYSELREKGLIKEMSTNGNKLISLTDKGHRFLEKYKTIVSFIAEFEL